MSKRKCQTEVFYISACINIFINYNCFSTHKTKSSRNFARNKRKRVQEIFA